MNQKLLFTILIILSIFSHTDAACATAGAAAPKCCCPASGAPAIQAGDEAQIATCDAATTCSAAADRDAASCKAGYGLVSGACTACVAPKVAPEGSTGVCLDCTAGMATCTVTGTYAVPVYTAVTCTAANQYVSSGACTDCADGTGSIAGNNNTACVSCGTNVKVCAVTGTMASPTQAITTCSDGYSKKTPATGDPTCESCGTGVKECTIDATGAVTAVAACLSGYGLKDFAAPATQKTCQDLSTLAVKGCLSGTITSAGVLTCLTCGADGYSTAAVTGSSPSQTCSSCTAANCGVCGATAAGACTKCKAGHYNAAAAGATFDCQPCAEGCASCPDGADGATKCSTVKNGWKLSAATAPATPVKCGGDGFTSNTATSSTCAVACPANCLTCNMDATKCEVCQADFELATDACVAIAAAERHPTCASASKKASADHCLSCVATQNRDMPEDSASTTTPKAKLTQCVCQEGFGDQSTLATPNYTCVACGDNATACTVNATGGITITACKADFFIAGVGVVGNKCLAKALSGIVGFFWDSVASKYAACHATCSKCTAGTDSSCSECIAAGTSWAAVPAEDAAGYEAYIKNYWLNASKCFNVCPTDYIADETQTGCVAGSAGNSIILSIVLVLTIIVSILF